MIFECIPYEFLMSFLNSKLFIRGLDYNTTVDELKIIFSEYGEIEECVIPTDRNSGKSK